MVFSALTDEGSQPGVRGGGLGAGCGHRAPKSHPMEALLSTRSIPGAPAPSSAFGGIETNQKNQIVVSE